MSGAWIETVVEVRSKSPSAAGWTPAAEIFSSETSGSQTTHATRSTAQSGADLVELACDAAHQRSRAHGDRHVSRQAEVRPWPNEEAALREPVGERGVVDVHAREYEVGRGRQRLGASFAKSPRQHLARLRDFFAPTVGCVPGSEASTAGREASAVHVERLVDDIEVWGESLVDDRVAEPKPGEPEELGEAAQSDDGSPVLHVELAPHTRRSAGR